MNDFVHVISTKTDGNMSFRYGPAEDVVVNRKKFLHANGIAAENCVAMSLQDSEDCITVSGQDKNRGMHAVDGIAADCLITKDVGLYLFTFVADCLPLAIHDERTEVVALAHISRRNAGERFIKNIVSALERMATIKPDQLICDIGPCIRQESYLLPPTVPQASDPLWQQFTHNRTDGSLALDLVGITVDALMKNGVPKKRIHDTGIDTATSSRHFSHYRDSRAGTPEGRFAVVVGMK